MHFELTETAAAAAAAERGKSMKKGKK